MQGIKVTKGGLKRKTPFFGVLGVIFLWWLVSRSGVISPYLLPSPIKVADTWIRLCLNGELFQHIVSSLFRVFVGFLLAFFAALLLGITNGICETISYYTRPLVDFLRNIPPLSLTPLFILWFGIGEKSKIALIFLAGFFPMFLNIEKGFSCCDRQLLEVGGMFGFTKWKCFQKIMLPYAVPDILTGMQVGLGYSFRAIVGAEMLAADSGLGYMIADAQYMARTDKVIAGIITIGITGYICNKAFVILVDRYIGGKWTDGGFGNQKAL